MRRAVVFPLPDGPTTTINSPSSMVKSRLSTAGIPSYTFETPSYAISATDLPFRLRESLVARCLYGHERAVSLVGEAAGLRVAEAKPRSEIVTRLDQMTVEVQQGGWVRALRFDVPSLRVDEREPRLAGGESTRRRGVPLHRMTHRVAASPVARRI